VVGHVEWKYYRRRRAAWPFAAVNLPFALLEILRFPHRDFSPLAGSTTSSRSLSTDGFSIGPLTPPSLILHIFATTVG